ncbi:hypothetical protein GZH47_33260 (plasmid) [Paenibacillus rhizovicinus]|uniref:Uncharacterized protein n=1 Tax=Paenibacillus rhizovicinus TaxID=2704463 RepID=A0A6C0PB12_9BACL|nr:hypothetical protein [Paenibacillus rhizovicinus]QHW35764.1 hypothetical protein GZH47_33260 [Paenibacillus rhizovicinus]
MLYNPTMEKIKAIDFVNQSMAFERDFDKTDKVRRAIQIALDEILEFENSYRNFSQQNQHLQVFQHLLKPILDERMGQMINHARHMMEKTYTTDELQELPEHVYQDVIAVQKQRVEVLKKIAKSYFS